MSRVSTPIPHREGLGVGLLLLFFISHFSLFTLSSCTEPESSLVEFYEDNNLNTPNDTVYSLLGIVNKIQKLADRTVILGEIRGDLTEVTENASNDLQQLANFTADANNAYNEVSDYYAVIQNCNFFLSRVDTMLTKRGEKVFAREYAAVKAFRAWTYLQLAIHYGSVPFVTQPILTEKEGDVNLYPKYDIQQIADYFITDLAPYVDTKTPEWGNMNSLPSTKLFIPVRVLLGDLCLWSGRYQEAAKYYHDYFTVLNNARPIGINRTMWTDHEFTMLASGYTSAFNRSGDETLSYILMETSEYNGIISLLPDVFNSTEDNNYYFQATSSGALKQLSRAQHYTMVYSDPSTQMIDTISPPDTLTYVNENMRGDLRLYSVLSQRSSGTTNTNYSSIRQTNSKFPTSANSNRNSVTHQLILPTVTTYRLAPVYLRYAEALNRAGYPESAFAVLKWGINYITLERGYISAAEQARAGSLIQFSQYSFTRENTSGIHSRGCGDADADTTYIIPSLPTRNDSILYVENLLVDEMALEESFEGFRFADLQRIALHRNDPSFLANKVARRSGTLDAALYQRLTDKKNWYLPLE